MQCDVFAEFSIALIEKVNVLVPLMVVKLIAVIVKNYMAQYN